ncbi:reticulophagy regulator 3-like isoform X2 [Chelonus insularis]|uniref:reticulophagy regulator 3-like isoform X2 n=1 Tax=Chelonus insularis TaxID=460826 RepID=UPI00158AA4CB|nr:reticulophagy regulator 3-like isoform X2 [Chelonus insularis]
MKVQNKIAESLLLWKNSVNSISVVIVFNILFWGIVVLEIRGFAAASSAALVVVLCYSTLESQIEKEPRSPSLDSMGSLVQSFQIDKMINKLKAGIENLKTLRKNQPGTFCIVACVTSIMLWVIGRSVNCILLVYVICMGLLVGPGLLYRIPKKVLISKEWENEMEEFLPAVTEDNLQLLNRVGETGNHSPTPPNGLPDHFIDSFDDEITGLKMPSHEDGSTDGLELSDELELSAGEIINDNGNLTAQSKHFEVISSSDEEELDLKSNDLSSNSDDSESEFEVIDSHDITSLSNDNNNDHHNL